MFGFGVIPSIALFLSLWFLFETPRWLVFHGDVNAAQEILKKIRPCNAVEKELSNIIKEHENMQQSKIGKINFTQITIFQSLVKPHYVISVSLKDTKKILIIIAKLSTIST